MIRSFRSKALTELFNEGATRRIDARMQGRIMKRLQALHAAERPESMNLPGFDFHALRGHDPVRYTIHVNGPWCFTFSFEGKDAIEVDYEQYH